MLEREISTKRSQNERKNGQKTSNKGEESSNFKFGQGNILKKTTLGSGRQASQHYATVSSNLLIYNTSFDSSNGAHFDCALFNDSYIGNFQINNCSLASGENGVKFSGSSTSYVNDIKITNSDFKSARFNAAIINPIYFESCEISNNSFESMGDIAVTVSPTNVPSVTGELIISGNDFYSNKTRSIDVNFSVGTYQTSITDNTFTGVAVQALGYAAQIQTSGGTTCLDFVGNQSTPINFGGSADPYYFLNTSGTFNLTPESTQQNNTGTIQQSGSFGSCP